MLSALRVLAALLALFALAAPADAGHPAYGSAQLVVTNHSGTTLSVSLAGQRPVVLHPRQQVVLYGPPGQRDLVATARHRGVEHLVENRRVHLRPGRVAEVVVGPMQVPHYGLLSVDSRHGLAARIVVDGRYVASVGPYGHTRVELPQGPRHVRILDAHGRVIQDAWVTVDPYRPVALHVGSPRSHRYAGRSSGRSHRVYAAR